MILLKNMKCWKLKYSVGPGNNNNEKNWKQNENIKLKGKWKLIKFSSWFSEYQNYYAIKK